jgi:hypothetical protein
VAAWVSDMFQNFYSAKNSKIAYNSTTTKAREKNKHRFGILRFIEKFRGLTNFKNNQILPNQRSHQFLLTTKLFTWQKRLII